MAVALCTKSKFSRIVAELKFDKNVIWKKESEEEGYYNLTCESQSKSKQEKLKAIII